jgi:peroxiredoxin
MPIKVGEKLPDVEVQVVKPSGTEKVRTGALFAGKKSVLFSVPGAFTPTCSAKHLPGFIDHAGEIRAKGVDQIVCMSVNDAFVMSAWGKDRGAGDKVVLLADGCGEFAKALDLELDASGYGMGLRSQRFAAIIDDGKVAKLFIEKPGAFEVSSAEAVLQQL